MEHTYFENNKAEISGEVVGEPFFSHEIYGEKFYQFPIRVPRLSNNSDVINVTFSERFFPEIFPSVGEFLQIEGQFRSYNNFTDIGNRLVLTVFAKTIHSLSHISDIENPNQIFLNGYICKQPVYRTTPFQREISDILLAVNRFYNKSDYIPCIAWGRNAIFAETLAVGTQLKIWGRIQSRDYQKKLTETEVVTKTAYEISITKMEVVKHDMELEINNEPQ